ncbi:MAG: hypothetical protein JO106_14120, partial [Mycobacterium sp.]|nr:hypothetical protein [Mycobacterium sp.]
NIFRHPLGAHDDKAFARVDLSGDFGIEHGKKLIKVAGEYAAMNFLVGI